VTTPWQQSGQPGWGQQLPAGVPLWGQPQPAPESVVYEAHPPYAVPPAFAQQPQPFPQGAPFGPIPPRRPGAGMWWALGTTAVVVAVALTLVLTLSGRSGPDDPGEAVEQFLAAIVDGEYSTAYDLMCVEKQRDAGGLREFTEDVRDDPPALAIEWRVGEVRSMGGDRWGVTVILSAYGETDGGEILVIEEGGEYRVCGPA
jgi:hypothetical protein